MLAYKNQVGGRNGLKIALVAAGTLFSCTDDHRSVRTDASGGFGQGEGASASSGGTESGGSPAGGAGTESGGDSLGGHAGEVGNACSAEFLAFPLSMPPDLVQDSGHGLLSPLFEDGHASCPNGTIPSERFPCLDTPICACEYLCTPGCGTSEVCIPSSAGNVCSCHAAMDGEPGDCQWKGLFNTEVFDACDAWSFTIFDNGFPTVAELAEGTLHLAVEQRCQSVFAQIVARRPPAEVFPEGAALVFDYSALGEPATDQPQPTSVRFESIGAALLPSAVPQQYRLCVPLDQYPGTVELTFSVANHGICLEESPAELWVSNLRLEADNHCL